MSVYSNVDDCRELARSVLPIEFPDTEILEELTHAQSKIWTVTKKLDWSSSDFQYEFITQLARKEGARTTLEHYNLNEQQLRVVLAWKVEVEEGLDTIVKSSVDPAHDIDIKVIASKYESYPLSLEDDANAQPYRSTDLQVT